MGRFAVAAVFLSLLLAPIDDAAAFRCNGSLVSEGDRRFQVERACGEPDHVESVTDPYYARYWPYDEIWYYNFGPQRMLRVLHFRDGRLRRIETAGYGFREDQADRRPCRPRDLSSGMTSYELIQRCGEPVDRTYRRVSVPPSGRHQHGHRQRTVEDWYYHQDERYRPRRVRIRDGIVIEVSTRLD